MKSLDQILVKGLEEARRLFYRDECAFTARYVLNEVRKKYDSEKQTVPDELNALQEDFDRSVNKYPEKIQEAIKSSDYQKAASLFSAFIFYTQHTGIVPEQFKELEEEIRKKEREAEKTGSKLK